MDELKTAWFAAASRLELHDLRRLQPGVPVNTRDAHGDTALHCAAASYGAQEVIAFLIEAGADVNARDGQHRNVVELAWMGAASGVGAGIAGEIEALVRQAGFEARAEDLPGDSMSLRDVEQCCAGAHAVALDAVALALCADAAAVWRTGRVPDNFDATLPERALRAAEQGDLSVIACMAPTATRLADRRSGVDPSLRYAWLALYNFAQRRVAGAPVAPEVVIAQALRALAPHDQQSALREALAAAPAPPIAPLAAWPQRPSFLREGLYFAVVVLAAGVACMLVALSLLWIIVPRDPVMLMILGFGLWPAVGFPLAYKHTIRRSDRVRPGMRSVRLYADHVEVDRAGEPPWRLPRVGLTVEAGWFQGIAGDRIFSGADNVSYGRGYTAVILAYLASEAHSVVFVADGDVSPAYTSPIPRWDELGSRWPGAPRVRLKPAHLVDLVTRIA